MRRWLIIFALLAVAGASINYRREAVRSSTDYTDPLRYERLSEVGIRANYLKEPLVAWKIVSGRKRLELASSSKLLTCMDEHLLLGHPFEASKQPANIGEALDWCNAAKAD